MSLTTLLRSSGSMNNRSLIIIHSLKHSAHDFWTEASDCTYCLCTTLSTDTLLLTIYHLSCSCIVAYRIIHFVRDMTCCGHTESPIRGNRALSHELHIFVQTLSYDNRSRQKLAGTRKVLAVHISECYMVNSKSYEHLCSMRD